MSLTVPTGQAYVPRHVERLDAWSNDEWALKVYWMTVDGAPPDDLALNAARSGVWEALETKSGYGLGFVIVHRGQLADWIVLGWWTDGDILRRRVLTHEKGEITDRSDEDFLGCVWELSVIDWERKAWINTILRHHESADPRDYLRAVYPSSFC